MSGALRGLLWAIPFVSVLSAQETGLDVRLFRSINGQQNPDRYGLFEFLDHSSVPTFAAVPAGLLIVGGISGNGRAIHTGLITSVAQLTALGLTTVLKLSFARPRPFEVLPNVKVKHRWSAGGYGFPSGHASQAFAIATALSFAYSRASVTVPLYAWAAAVGFGRIYLGLHYPSDFLGGIAVGALCGALAWSLRADLDRIAAKMSGSERAARLLSPSIRLVNVHVPL